MLQVNTQPSLGGCASDSALAKFYRKFLYLMVESRKCLIPSTAWLLCWLGQCLNFETMILEVLSTSFKVFVFNFEVFEVTTSRIGRTICRKSRSFFWSRHCFNSLWMFPEFNLKSIYWRRKYLKRQIINGGVVCERCVFRCNQLCYMLYVGFVSKKLVMVFEQDANWWIKFQGRSSVIKTT